MLYDFRLVELYVIVNVIYCDLAMGSTSGTITAKNESNLFLVKNYKHGLHLHVI